MGGSDDPSNLIELSVEEHAEAHKKLWEKYGKWQDNIAWKTLSGQISQQDVIQIMMKSHNPMFRDDVKVKMSGDNHWSKRKGNIHNWLVKNPMHNQDVLKKMSGDNHWSKRPGKIHNAKTNHPKGNSKKILVNGVIYDSIREAANELKVYPRNIKQMGKFI